MVGVVAPLLVPCLAASERATHALPTDATGGPRGELPPPLAAGRPAWRRSPSPKPPQLSPRCGRRFAPRRWVPHVSKGSPHRSVPYITPFLLVAMPLLTFLILHSHGYLIEPLKSKSMVIDCESKTLNITDIAGWEQSVARSGRKRARERLRPERIKPMSEPAKERILRALLRYFYLTAIQVGRTCGYSPRSITHVQTHLKDLADAGYILRLFLPRPSQHV